MHALSIIEAFDPGDDIEPGLLTRLIAVPMDTFDFQGLEETLHRRIVPTVGAPTHGLNHSVILDQFPVTLAGVLPRSVCMMRPAGGFRSQ
jgi:hypothetical protein